jgi:hypothetical protein
MPSAAFEPATPATKQPQTYALDRAATEVGSKHSDLPEPWNHFSGFFMGREKWLHVEGEMIIIMTAVDERLT